MTISRRQFLRNTGLAAAYLALPAWLSACQRDAAPVAIPLAQPETWDDPQPGAHPEIVHLLNRVTYGPRPGEVERVAQLGWEAFLEQQLDPDQIDDSALDARLAQFTTLTMTNAERFAAYPMKGQPGPRAVIQELEVASLLRAIFSERQLFEIMVDFWSNYLNIFIGKNQVKWLKTGDDREVVRKHALGKFRDLLLASAKSPAMLVYLDNAENVKPGARPRAQGGGGLNENYAREVMELHTVGADGGYTQDDVTAVARTLTGWTIARRNADDAGDFQFVPRLHDDGEKRIAFLDLTLPAGGGIEQGETLLARLATHPRTAARIARKLCIAFVSDDPPSALVDRAAQAYLDCDTDIRATLGVILRSDEFKAAAGQKIKLPLRALVSSLRVLGASVDDGVDGAVPLVRGLRDLGQAFFAWPAPNGYPQVGAAWVNTGGMLGRWNGAFALAEGRVKGVAVDLHNVAPAGSPPTAGALVDAIGASLLHAPLPAPARDALVEYTSEGKGAQWQIDIKTLERKLPELTGLILASPAFQTH
jgi:uncharacterized protein (DUF1800 family)